MSDACEARREPAPARAQRDHFLNFSRQPKTTSARLPSTGDIDVSTRAPTARDRRSRQR